MRRFLIEGGFKPVAGRFKRKSVTSPGDRDSEPRDFGDLESIMERVRTFFEIEVSILSILDFQGCSSVS